MIWQCNSKYEGEARCETPHLTEEHIRAAFVRAMNKLITDKDCYLTELRAIAEMLSDTSALEIEATRTQLDVAAAADAINEAVSENARVAQDQTEFKKRYDELVGMYQEAEARLHRVEDQIEEKKSRREKIERFIRQVAEMNGVVGEFSPALWASMVESVTVFEGGRMTFLLTCGTEAEVPAQR